MIPMIPWLNAETVPVSGTTDGYGVIQMDTSSACRINMTVSEAKRIADKAEVISFTPYLCAPMYMARLTYKGNRYVTVGREKVLALVHMIGALLTKYGYS